MQKELIEEFRKAAFAMKRSGAYDNELMAIIGITYTTLKKLLYDPIDDITVNTPTSDKVVKFVLEAKSGDKLTPKKELPKAPVSPKVTKEEPDPWDLIMKLRDTLPNSIEVVITIKGKDIKP